MLQMIHFIQNSIQDQCLYRGKMKYVFNDIVKSGIYVFVERLFLILCCLSNFILPTLRRRYTETCCLHLTSA